eukprot:TRINITY_DN36682_c0_g1_i1.p2 TRINITY_DN36682_c0_g1~~TRINITY_DN36682_c0_g1_i1.p2  ORF type:complete len:165 (-),score=46.54 TRINITY_DN36682_c0_g1_i1:387-881(-)
MALSSSSRFKSKEEEEDEPEPEPEPEQPSLLSLSKMERLEKLVEGERTGWAEGLKREPGLIICNLGRWHCLLSYSLKGEEDDGEDDDLLSLKAAAAASWLAMLSSGGWGCWGSDAPVRRWTSSLNVFGSAWTNVVEGVVLTAFSMDKFLPPSLSLSPILNGQGL